MSDSDYYSDSDSDSDSGTAEDPTASVLKGYAKEILWSPSHQGLAIVLRQLSMEQETTEYNSGNDVFTFCVNRFVDRLSVMLLRVYLGSHDGVTRFLSIYLLSQTLQDLRDGGTELGLNTLRAIKPLLITCLTRQETRQSDINILRRIVSCVAYNVESLDDEGWMELRDCIFTLLDSNPRRAFHVFHYLPANYGELIFFDRDVDGTTVSAEEDPPKVFEKAKKFLCNTERVQDWNLAFFTILKLGLLFPDSQGGSKAIILKSAKHVVREGMAEFLDRWLDDLTKFLAQDGKLCNYYPDQGNFVVRIAFKIANCYRATEDAKELGEKMLHVVQNPEEYNKKHVSGFDRDCHWCDHLKNSDPLQVFRIFASTDIEEWSRELAIRVLNELLSHHTSKKVLIDLSVMRQLQPLLISCLEQQGISHNIFQVLGQVVHHVAYEMMSFRDETWDDLRDYIVSRSQTEFERAVYIFRCLLMPLKGDEFVIPVTGILLPEISKRLKSLTDDMFHSSWVLAFTGAFCATIHLMMITNDTETVKEIENSMVDSVSEHVERRLESGLVRTAFRDVESIVKKQLELIGTSEYKFVERVVNKQLKWLGRSEYTFLKRLLRRFYEIKGMTIESRTVLWRINVILERGVDQQVKKPSS